MNRQDTLGTARIRVDQELIAKLVTPGSRLIDVGCGDGVLLDLLVHERQVDGRGIELSQEGVNTCVARGLAVVQGDAETDLNNYPDDAFDFALLSQTLPAIFDVKGVLRELLRIGRCAVVSFPTSATGACARTCSCAAAARSLTICPMLGTSLRTSGSSR